MPIAYIGRMKKAAAVLALLATCAAGCAAETDAADDVEGAEDALAQIGAEPAGRPSRHAIVLAHGFDASDTNRWSFYQLKDALERDGHVVHAARVQPYRGVPDRAKELATHVDEAIAECRAEGIEVEGPLPADTVFVPSHARGFDAIVAMYHDQGLPVLKAASFGRGVNVTLGLPFPRTSVDHGTALDLAADPARAAGADPGSLFEAIDLATALSRSAAR